MRIVEVPKQAYLVSNKRRHFNEQCLGMDELDKWY